jgi:molybdopterin molybdotransferase
MKNLIGFDEALDFTLSSVPPTETETLFLEGLTGRVLSEDIVARVDSPSVDSSLKDGYAVMSEDLRGAGKENPVQLIVIGRLTAGISSNLNLKPGQAVEITTGGAIPHGADAVIMEENCSKQDESIRCFRPIRPGENVFRKGADTQKGEIALHKGEQMSPARLGLMASAGLEKATVRKTPRVAVISTGDEVVAPGNPLCEGQLYASNMIEICSWLSSFGMSYQAKHAHDRKEEIESVIVECLPHVDAFVTIGGAWGSDRDLMIDALEGLGWQGVYHKVRMRPGKAVGFGLLGNRPFFFLPGAPPANEMAFIQLVLPGLLAMEGCPPPPFPWVTARLGETVRGDKKWTQFLDARFSESEEGVIVQPVRHESRLQAMAQREALIVVPEGSNGLTRGEETRIQLLTPFIPHFGISPSPSETRVNNH